MALHQDVRRAVAPAGLETQGEPSVGPHFEAIVREWRARDIAAEPLEAPSVARRDGDPRSQESIRAAKRDSPSRELALEDESFATGPSVLSLATGYNRNLRAEGP